MTTRHQDDAARPGQAARSPAERGMTTALLAAGLGLAEALRAENAALAALDLPRAAHLAETKIKASDAFAAAHAAAIRTGTQAEGEVRRAIEMLASQLQALGSENRRLLERAVTVQSRVIETIAGAARPAVGDQRYRPAGSRGAAPGQATPLALVTRV